MSNKFRTVNFIFPKTNNYGLLKDCRLLESYFAKCQFRCQRLDPHEPPKPADINVHLEIPVYANIAWAPVNILLVNPEYYTDAFEAYTSAFDILIIRDSATHDLYYHESRIADKEKFMTMPFCTPTNFADIKMPMTTDAKWIWVIGGSKHKIAAAKVLLGAMEDGDQPVKIITSAKDELRPFLKANCQFADKEYDDEQLAREQKTTAGHIVVSEAEGFSHANAEAYAAGAYRLGTKLPTIIESSNVGDTMMTYIGNFCQPDETKKYYKVSMNIPREQVRAEWLKAQTELGNVTSEDRKRVVDCAQEDSQFSERIWTSRIKEWKALAEERAPGARHVPPVIEADSCPMISIVTPTYNRRDIIDLCFHNLLWSDYPLDKIQWIVVEDSDDPMKGASDKLVEFAGKAKGLDFTYIPLQGRRTVGYKRNVGCEAAKHDIIVFMDDDDHYPPTSFRRRVSWLTKPLDGRAAASVVGCTMIAMYDLKRGTSAVNVPPWALPLGQRISEASLAFRKSFWRDRPFTDIHVAEGEEWLAGREAGFLEIPPQQIIVAFSHGNNSCSRRIPDDAPVSCFWNFSPQYLTFVHGLAGVKVELQDATKPSGPKVPKGPKAKKK
jgi:hypothetical protein